MSSESKPVSKDVLIVGTGPSAYYLVSELKKNPLFEPVEFLIYSGKDFSEQKLLPNWLTRENFREPFGENEFKLVPEITILANQGQRFTVEDLKLPPVLERKLKTIVLESSLGPDPWVQDKLDFSWTLQSQDSPPSFEKFFLWDTKANHKFEIHETNSELLGGVHGLKRSSSGGWLLERDAPAEALEVDAIVCAMDSAQESYEIEGFEDFNKESLAKAKWVIFECELASWRLFSFLDFQICLSQEALRYYSKTGVFKSQSLSRLFIQKTSKDVWKLSLEVFVRGEDLLNVPQEQINIFNKRIGGAALKTDDFKRQYSRPIRENSKTNVAQGQKGFFQYYLGDSLDLAGLDRSLAKHLKLKISKAVVTDKNPV